VGQLIAERDQVRVASLTGAAADHLIIVTAERPPRVGDIGTVVDIADRLGGNGRHYTVALTHPDARPIWLAVFAAHELELVASAWAVGPVGTSRPNDR
jgi:hypothetical protein